MKLHSEEWPYLLPELERSVVVAYALWIVWGMLGVHRFYLGRLPSGFLWLLTGGLFGLGWLFDLFAMPRLVEQYRRRREARGRERAARARPDGPLARLAARIAGRRRRAQPMLALLEGAAAQNGRLTVTQGVMATGLPFREVEATLREMAASGYVDVRNDPETGVVQYVFPELERGPHARAGTP